MNSNYVHGNTGLAGLSGSKSTPTFEEERKIAWKAAIDAQKQGLPLVRIAGARLNFGSNGKGNYGQWKEYWQAFGSPTPATARKINQRWKDKFPEVYNNNPPAKYIPKGQPKTQKNNSGSQTENNSSGNQVMEPKQSGTNWLGWGVGLAVLGGAAWYFKPDENKKKN